MLTYFSGGEIRFTEPDDPDDINHPAHSHVITKSLAEKIAELRELPP